MQASPVQTRSAADRTLLSNRYGDGCRERNGEERRQMIDARADAGLSRYRSPRKLRTTACVDHIFQCGRVLRLTAHVSGVNDFMRDVRLDPGVAPKPPPKLMVSQPAALALVYYQPAVRSPRATFSRACDER